MAKKEAKTAVKSTEATTRTTSHAAARQAGVYTKQQFLTAKQFSAQRDLLHALLAEDTRYTTMQVQKLIESFLQKEAN